MPGCWSAPIVSARGSSFSEALESDILDIQGGTTPEGVHLGAMAGTVDLRPARLHGTRDRDEVLWFDPCLPAELSELRIQHPLPAPLGARGRDHG